MAQESGNVETVNYKLKKVWDYLEENQSLRVA